MSSNRSGVKVWTPVIAAAVGDKEFVARDVPTINPEKLRKLANFGYLIVVKKHRYDGRTYLPTVYRLNTNAKHVRDAMETAK